RFGTPEGIGGLAAFIFSEEASYINGEVLTMDGGRWLNGFPFSIHVSERGQVMPGAEKNKHSTWKKIILYSGGLLILLVAGALIYVNHFLNKSLPQVEGEIEMPVSEHVSVTTDDVGVPHIQAESLEDMYKVQGYVQAKSRMFQMEMSRRQASGTLSEVVGADTVSSDKYFRTLGLRRAAEASYDLYDDDAKDVL